MSQQGPLSNQVLAQGLIANAEGQGLAAVRNGTSEQTAALLTSCTAVFDSSENRWITQAEKPLTAERLEGVYQPCFSARDRLLETVNKYRRKLKEPAWQLSSTHSWGDVESSLQSTCQALEEVSKKDKDLSSAAGKLRGAFRTLCRCAGVGHTFASILPNDSLGLASAVCGGFKVIFLGLQKMGIYREEIYRTLEDLPYVLSDHTVSGDVPTYSEDEELHGRAALLYASVFKLLEHILQWFVKNAVVTTVKMLVDPTGFSDQLKDRSAEVKTRAQRFEQRALKLSRQCQNNSRELLYWAAFFQQRIAQDVKVILSDLLDQKIARAELLEKFDSVFKPSLDTPSVQSSPRPAALPPVPSPAHLFPSSISTARATLLQTFLYDASMLPADVGALSRPPSALRASRYPLDLDRVATLQASPRLRAWLTVDGPGLLLVNGRAAARPMSETSWINAKIVERLLDRGDVASGRSTSPTAPGRSTVTPDTQRRRLMRAAADPGPRAIVVPLAFFCGQHRDAARDPNACAAEAAMSLLLQLVDQAGDAELLPAEALERARKRITPGSVSGVCEVLEELLVEMQAQLLAGRRAAGAVVFVVVVLDGLRFFAAQREMRELVARLVGIYRRFGQGRRARADGRDDGLTLKMLFSSPTRSEFVEDLFDDEERLAMVREVRRAGGVNPAARVARVGVEFGVAAGQRQEEWYKDGMDEDESESD